MLLRFELCSWIFLKGNKQKAWLKRLGFGNGLGKFSVWQVKSIKDYKNSHTDSNCLLTVMIREGLLCNTIFIDVTLLNLDSIDFLLKQKHIRFRLLDCYFVAI